LEYKLAIVPKGWSEKPHPIHKAMYHIYCANICKKQGNLTEAEKHMQTAAAADARFAMMDIL